MWRLPEIKLQDHKISTPLIVNGRINLVPRVSHLSSLALVGKMRDPGNEVVDVYIASCEYFCEPRGEGLLMDYYDIFYYFGF